MTMLSGKYCYGFILGQKKQMIILMMKSLQYRVSRLYSIYTYT